MARTTSDLVIAILGSNYGVIQGSLPSLTPFIDIASAIVNRVAICADNKEDPLTATELELLERWLAAHAYVQMDQVAQSESTSSASITYQGKTGMNLQGSKYGQMALTLDPSGCLKAVSEGSRARMVWLGQATSEQTPYDQRQ